MNILTKLFERDYIGIDLGSANMRVWVRGRGLVMDEPAIVTMQVGSKRVLAIGAEAKEYLGKTPGNLIVIRPLKSGVIADFDITKAMLGYCFAKVKAMSGYKFRRPCIVVAVPSGITEVEKRALEEGAHDAGAGDVFLFEAPMAAAIGAGLPVAEPKASMVVDIGGGTCEMAIISLAGIVHCYSQRQAGGDAMDEAIVDYIQRVYNCAIDERTAEDIKIKIGSVLRLDSEIDYELKGFNVVRGRPTAFTINSREIREEALAEVLDRSKEAVRTLLKRAEQGLFADLMGCGFILTGCGALLRGLDKRLASATGLPVRVADDPAHATIRGVAVVLDEIDFLSKTAKKHK